MKRLPLFILALFLASPLAAQSVLLETFETAGGYTTDITEFTDGSSDYFLRTDGTDISSFVEFSNIQGDFFFAAQDIDGEGAPSSAEMTFTGLDITGLSDLEFSAFFAEDDDGTNQDWDDDTEVIVEVQIDGGGFMPIFAIQAEAGASSFNNVPRVDTNFDGVGDGTEITSTFTEFTAYISGTGNTLDLRIAFNVLNAGDEDIAVDNVSITAGGLPVELTSFDALAMASGVLLDWTTATETNNAGFDVQQLQGDRFASIGFVEGQGSTTEAQAYSYTVSGLAPGTHTFRLKQIDFDGSFEYSAEIEVDVTLASTYELVKAYPNPFNPSTTFALTVATEQQVSVEVLTCWDSGCGSPSAPRRGSATSWRSRSGANSRRSVTSPRWSIRSRSSPPTSCGWRAG